MNFGLRCPGENFGTGKRLRMPRRATAEHTEVPIAHTRSVHRRPTFSRRTFRMNGKTKPGESVSVGGRSYVQRGRLPPTPVPEKIIPPASPRRSENHSGRSLITGMYSRPPPMPTPTPWSRMSCHTYQCVSQECLLLGVPPTRTSVAKLDTNKDTK